MSRTLKSAGIAGLTVGAALSAALLIAPAANASQTASVQLAPGQQYCVQQYAAYQVRGDGSAKKGAQFSLRRNGVVISQSPNNINAWAAEARTAYGTFPGAGTYQVCAVNTGTATTAVSLTIRTDGEI